MGPELIAAISAAAPYAAGVSAVSQIASQRGVEKRQQQLAEAMRQYGVTKAGEQQAATQKYIDTINPEARAEQLTAAKGDVQRSIEQTVAEAVKAQPAGPGYGGRVSEDYARSRATGAEDTAAKIKRAIEQLSVGASTGKLATDDDVRLRRAAGDLQAAGTASSNVGNQYAQAIQTVRPNSGLTALGQLSGALATLGFANPAAASSPIALASKGAGIGGVGSGVLGLKASTVSPLGLRL